MFRLVHFELPSVSLARSLSYSSQCNCKSFVLLRTRLPASATFFFLYFCIVSGYVVHTRIFPAELGHWSFRRSRARTHPMGHKITTFSAIERIKCPLQFNGKLLIGTLCRTNYSSASLAAIQMQLSRKSFAIDSIFSVEQLGNGTAQNFGPFFHSFFFTLNGFHPL